MTAMQDLLKLSLSEKRELAGASCFRSPIGISLFHRMFLASLMRLVMPFVTASLPVPFIYMNTSASMRAYGDHGCGVDLDMHGISGKEPFAQPLSSRPVVPQRRSLSMIQLISLSAQTDFRGAFAGIPNLYIPNNTYGLRGAGWGRLVTVSNHQSDPMVGTDPRLAPNGNVCHQRPRVVAIS
jgi:hypothetical protein